MHAMLWCKTLVLQLNQKIPNSKPFVQVRPDTFTVHKYKIQLPVEWHCHFQQPLNILNLAISQSSHSVVASIVQDPCSLSIHQRYPNEVYQLPLDTEC